MGKNLPQPPPFAERLLAWWDQHGRKDLPWQHPRTPYRVWVSEIMLQQTQVTTVIPYFARWMQRFPDITALALAPQDEVLELWAGLGYYARARNLHRAAQLCMQQHEGALPASGEELSALPGIGRSTANAIVSQSTNQPAAVLDGNVRRVLARHARVAGWTGSTKVQKQLWQQAEALLPTTRGADYTQAIMDLGAMMCRRTSPECEACPVASDCQARITKTIHLYPGPKPETRVSDREVFMLILHDKDKGVLLEKRPPSGIWGGLWSLPEAGDLPGLEQSTGFSMAQAHMLPTREHRLSHQRMHIQPLLLHTLRSEQVRCSTEQCWVELDRITELGMPKPVTDLLNELNHGEFA